MVEFTGTGDMFAACLCGHSISKPFHEAVGCALVAIRIGVFFFSKKFTFFEFF